MFFDIFIWKIDNSWPTSQEKTCFTVQELPGINKSKMLLVTSNAETTENR